MFRAMMRYALPLFALVLFAVPASAFEIHPNTKQVLVGIASDWNSSYVTLTLYERKEKTGLLGKKKTSEWTAVAGPWKGRLGHSGLVWGRGLHPVPAGARTKREGDGRSPAGAFLFGEAYGYRNAEKVPSSQKYTQITTRDMWYEDVNSPKYNTHEKLPHEPRTTAEKKAQMKQGDHAHSLKLFIKHNAKPNIVAGAGSSIFFHIWRRGGAAATAGCTTMPEDKLRSLIARIDPSLSPVYVLLPQAEYEKYRGPWKLP